MQDLLFSHWCFIQMLRGFHQMVLTSIPFCIFLHLDLSCYVLRTRLYGVYLDIEIDPAIIKIIDLINFIYTSLSTQSTNPIRPLQPRNPTLYKDKKKKKRKKPRIRNSIGQTSVEKNPETETIRVLWLIEAQARVNCCSAWSDDLLGTGLWSSGKELRWILGGVGRLIFATE